MITDYMNVPGFALVRNAKIHQKQRESEHQIAIFDSLVPIFSRAEAWSSLHLVSLFAVLERR
jgi:hypothetical protein